MTASGASSKGGRSVGNRGARPPAVARCDHGIRNGPFIDRTSTSNAPSPCRSSSGILLAEKCSRTFPGTLAHPLLSRWSVAMRRRAHDESFATASAHCATLAAMLHEMSSIPRREGGDVPVRQGGRRDGGHRDRRPARVPRPGPRAHPRPGARHHAVLRLACQPSAGIRRQDEPAAVDARPMLIPAPRVAPTEATRRWAVLVQQIVEVDPLACPTCRGAMRLVACMTQPSVIDQILTHLRTHAAHAAHADARSRHRRGPARAEVRHAPHARPPPPRPSREYAPPDAPPPAGTFGVRGGPTAATPRSPPAPAGPGSPPSVIHGDGKPGPCKVRHV